MASVRPISRPGSTPAMNSAAIDTVPPAASEYSTALWLGGIRIACTEPLRVTAVAKLRRQPLRTISGISTEPIDAVSATDEAEMAPKKVETMMLTSDSPPRTKPTSTPAKSTRRRAMPPSAMIAPASTKKGIASSESLFTPGAIWIITASSGSSIHSAPISAARPSE